MSTTPAPTVRPQLLLPGQAAAPAGPVDMNIMYVMHHGFRRDLDDFVAAATGTPATDRPTWRALERRWALFGWILHNHHSGEDAELWPALLARADETERSVLGAMEAEHAEIDPLLTGCEQGFRRLATHTDEDARAALVVRLTATRERLGAHLAHEETDAIALLQRVLTQQEWEQIDETFKQELTPRRILQVVPWAMHALPTDAREWIATQPGGAGYRLVWAVTRGSFERRHRQAFRHAVGASA